MGSVPPSSIGVPLPVASVASATLVALVALIDLDATGAERARRLLGGKFIPSWEDSSTVYDTDNHTERDGRVPRSGDR